jgi:hypothetical protein
LKWEVRDVKSQMFILDVALMISSLYIDDNAPVVELKALAETLIEKVE